MKKSYFVMAILASILLSACLIIGCGSGATSGGGGGSGVSTGTSPWLYFANYNTSKVYYITPDSLTISGTIDLYASPYHIVASPDGKKLYVALEGTDEVAVIDTGTNTITGRLTLDAGMYSQSRAMAVSKDGKILYLGATGGNNLYKIYVDTGTKESVGTTSFIQAMILDPDLPTIYFSNNDGEIRKGSTSTLSSSLLINVFPFVCHDMVEKGTKIYAPLFNNSTGECLTIDMTNDAISLITGEGAFYWGAADNPASDEVYISSYRNPGKIYVINTLASPPTFEAGSIAKAGFQSADYIAVTAADGKRVCAMAPLTGVSKLYYIDTTTKTVSADETTIPAGNPQLNNIIVVYK
jgi:YVTN family beta-propeller protein